MGRQLTFEEVAAFAWPLWQEGDLVAEAVATSWVESNHRPWVANFCCVGLWGINANAHRLSRKRLKEPRYNAERAHAIWASAGGSFERDWRVNWGRREFRKYNRALRRAKKVVIVQSVGLSFGNKNPLESVRRAAEGALAVGRDAIDEPFDWVDDLARTLFPVLLQVAVAGTGLALIGYGVKSLFGSEKAAEHVTKAAPIAAGAAK